MALIRWSGVVQNKYQVKKYLGQSSCEFSARRYLLQI